MTFHFESGSHPNKQGNYTIFLSVFHQGERKRIKTSINVPIRYWDSSKERIKKTCPTAKQDNEELQRLMDRAGKKTIEGFVEEVLKEYKYFDGFDCDEMPKGSDWHKKVCTEKNRKMVKLIREKVTNHNKQMMEETE